MANKYLSIARRYVAKQVYKTVIPPAATGLFTIPWGNFQNRMFTIDHSAINAGSNIACRSVGVFCNFADGLVFKVPHHSIQLHVKLMAYWNNPAAPLETGFVYNDHATPFRLFTDGSADLSLYDNDVLIRAGDDRYCYRTGVPGGPAGIDILDVVPTINNTLTPFKKLTWVGSSLLTPVVEIETLNEMHPYEHIFNLPDLGVSSPQQIDFIVLIASIYCPYDMTFSTRSISPDFEGDEVFFDAVLDLETTKKYL